MTSSKGRTTHGAGLRLDRTRNEHVQFATEAEQALFVAVAEMALAAAVTELALVD